MNASLRQMNALVVSTPSPLILIFDISESMEASLQCVLHFLYILDLVLKDDIVKNEIWDLQSTEWPDNQWETVGMCPNP